MLHTDTQQLATSPCSASLSYPVTGLPHLGESFRLRLPAEDAPCRGYAEIIAQVLEDAGAEVTVEE